MEFENLPEDCKQSLGDIERILRAANLLKDFVAIAPDIVAPRTGINLNSLWRFGYKARFDADMKGAKVKRLLDPITRNRIRLVIELEIYKHESANDHELVEHWSHMLEAYGGI